MKVENSRGKRLGVGAVYIPGVGFVPYDVYCRCYSSNSRDHYAS